MKGRDTQRKRTQADWRGLVMSPQCLGSQDAKRRQTYREAVFSESLGRDDSKTLLILNFKPKEVWENNVLLFKLPCLRWLVMATPENTKIYMASMPSSTCVSVTSLALRALELQAILPRCPPDVPRCFGAICNLPYLRLFSVPNPGPVFSLA